jgi:hypothetical protein
MATNDYITLTNSNASHSKRFKVTQMAPTLDRTDETARTISGTLDKSAGVILAMHQYIIRVKAESADSQYGSLSDLQYFFKLNNPNGVPSDKIVLTDHYGDNHNCIFIGSLGPENVTTMLEGVNAIFFCKIQLGEIDAVTEDDTPSL